MRVLITGAGGMLGQDVCAAAALAGHQPIPLSHAELDITDPDAVSRCVMQAKPEAVINCAAFTKVDLAETERDAARAANGDGAGHVARAAAATGAWTIHLSTDYVFDGAGTHPYVESDPAAPQSVYGATKLLGEGRVADAAPESHTVVRSSWLFGAGGACFPATIRRLAAERDELAVVDDQRGCPTFTGHLAPALITLAERRPRGVLHVAGAGDCTWFQFAQEIVSAAGEVCEVVPTTTAEMARPAPRPAFSVLGTERPAEAPVLPNWREGLTEFMSITVGSS
jgi:dTDP-4-dehydrorhamnose reductase